MASRVALVALGSLLWLGWGAVRNASADQVSANGYLLSLVIVGVSIGLLSAEAAPLQTGAWLVAPGAIALGVAGPEGHPDWYWWWLTVGVGAVVVATSIRLVRLVRPGRGR